MDYDEELHTAWVTKALHLAMEYREAEPGLEVRYAMRAMKAHLEGRPDSMLIGVGMEATDIETDELCGPVLAIRKLGYVCNGALAEKLWSRFSQDQCATWILIDEESIERFVAWICSGLERNEAWA